MLQILPAVHFLIGISLIITGLYITIKAEGRYVKLFGGLVIIPLGAFLIILGLIVMGILPVWWLHPTP